MLMCCKFCPFVVYSVCSLVPLSAHYNLIGIVPADIQLDSLVQILEFSWFCKLVSMLYSSSILSLTGSPQRQQDIYVLTHDWCQTRFTVVHAVAEPKQYHPVSGFPSCFTL